MTCLEVLNISKCYFQNVVINDFTYAFQSGCYCLVGPNGVGKTTLLEMLAGASSLTKGSITLKIDNDIHFLDLKYKKFLCYVPADPEFYPSVTGIEFINFIMSVKVGHQDLECDDAASLIDEFNIRPYLYTIFSDMSLGTRKKFFLLTMLIGNNKLIILDEPTNAIDGNSHVVLINLIKKLRAESIIIISTHDESLISALNPKIIKLSRS